MIGIKKFRLFFVLLFIVFFMAGLTYYRSTHEHDPHYHAGFQVYVDGVLQDFSSDVFMHAERCIVDTSHLSSDPSDWVHLHNNIGDVTHVHAVGIVWGQLFVNLGFEIDQTKPLKAYINGKEVTDILKESIKPYDSLVLLIGSYTDIPLCLQNQVKRERILYAETMTESCGK